MATQLFKVVARAGVKVRTAPRLNGPRVSTVTLGYGEILEVNSESRTEANNYEWWEHAQNPGWWSAARRTDQTETLMEPYQLEHEPAEDTVSDFMVMTDVLNVRSEPRLGDNLLDENLIRGEILRFRNPTKADGFLWWEQEQKPGHWSASGSLQGGQTFMLPSAPGEKVRLDVPWVTQLQSPINFANDCGHACVLMVMRYHISGFTSSVRELYQLPYKNANGTTNQFHLQDIAKEATGGKLYLQTFQREGPVASDFDILKNRVKAKHPVILLVRYSSLRFVNPSGGNFLHWLVMVGYTGNIIYVHDPLWATESSGAGRAISQDQLFKACVDSGYGLYGLL